jgi:O-antigen/teichoic acid export membrane protein
LIKRISDSLKNKLTQGEGLGYLQVYNLLKATSIVVISIIFAKFIKTPLLINNWETLMLMGTGYTFFYVSGMGYTLVSFVKGYQKTNWPEVFRNTFFLLFFFGSVSAAAIIITGRYTNSIAMPLNHLVLFSVYTIGTVCSTVNEYIYFLNRTYNKLLGWGLFNFLLFIALPTLPLLYGFQFIYALYALACIGIVKFIFTLSLINKPFYWKNLNYVKPLLKFNWPIIVSLIFGTGYIYFSTFIIKANVLLTEFNLFRYGSREFPLFIVMANSFSIVLGGLTVEKFNTPGFWTDLKKNHLRLLHQLFPMACVLMLSSKYIFELVFSPEFILSYPVFNILLLTLIARVLFPQSLLMGQSKTRFAFYSSVFEFFIGVILVVVLTPLYGIRGAAYGLVLAFFSEKFLLIVFCYRQNIAFHQSINFKWLALYSVLLILSFYYSLPS